VYRGEPRTVFCLMSSDFIGQYIKALFRLYQIVIRKVNDIGLKTEYETNDEVRSYVRCLPALAFIPPDDVMKAFELLDE